MNRNMSVPDKVYSVFKMGSASTDQHRRQARWQMSLLRHKSPYRTTLVPPSLILCIIKQQKFDLGQTRARDCIYVMLEKNDKVFTSTPHHLEKIVHCKRTMTWDSFCSGTESIGTKLSLQKWKAFHLIWQDELSSVMYLSHVSVLFSSDLAF